MEAIIKTNNLTKKYGDKLASDSVNISVNKGDIYGLIGRNGAGKTTVLKMITGLISPTSGKVDLNFSDKRKKSNIGVLIESPGLFYEFDGKANISLKMQALGIRKKGYEEELLKLVGLEGVKKKVKQYSLGMKQRLGLALALVDDPEVLILDEPTNGMDPQGMQDFRRLIQKLSSEKNITVIISSHILDELAKYATRFGIIDQGKLITQLSAKDLEEIDADKLVIKVDDASNVAELIKKHFPIEKMEVKENHEINIYDKISTREINKILVNEGIVVDEIHISHQSLENYYLTITGGIADV